MGIKTFKPHFHPSDFQGPLAGHYSEREDLFQHLVGAFLRERFGSRVHVSSTKGRDGSIDIFIDAGDDPDETFLGLHFPIIVECKDHDDTLGNVTNNAQAGWKKVQEKLTRKACEGWPGTFRPWRRARGYLYCISAVMPSPQSYQELDKQIADFFIKLPAAQKPPIERIYFLHWSDFHPLLNAHPRLGDAWLGIGRQGIIGHEAHEAGLTGFRAYLQEEKLPYLFPRPDESYHPYKILDSLKQEAGNSGIILVGAGGTGKTRACFEVARTAHRQGWRVLHVIPGEPAVTASDIADAVLDGATPTLLVFDYLDQLGGIDWGTIRHRLLPDAKLRTLPLALLANARPGIVRHANRERDSLFRRVEISLGDQRERITAHLQKMIAPNASDILGPVKVRELCGTRPIIGMFIARELEYYAEKGILDESIVTRLRGGDLQVWIRKRFQEDGLLPKETEDLMPPAPTPIMTATAAGLAASPIHQNEMFLVLERTLTACGDSEAATRALSLLASLIRSGWLEDRGSFLAAPHDVVADELLELTLCDRDCAIIRPGFPEKVFAGALPSPRIIGRFSVALDRVLGQAEFPTVLREDLQQSVTRWLLRHASELGLTLSMKDPDEVSYALGAVVTGIAWGEAALSAWDSFISPWLSQNSRNAEARHLLYRGLKGLPKGKSFKLFETALQWLGSNADQSEATYVLAPLLARQDLSQEAAKSAVTAATDWLKENRTTIDAQFVLAPLLARQDLSEEAAKSAVTAATDWLKENRTTIDAQFVLAPLLARQDLSEEAAKSAVTAATDWLKENRTTIDAGFVLSPLLARQDLSEEAAKSAVTAATDWLKENRTIIDAQFVLKSLLARQDLWEEAAKSAVTAATDWLKENRTTTDAGFVLSPLLARQDLSEEAAKSAVTAATDWLKENRTTTDAGFVLSPLLARQDLSEEAAKSAVTAATDWLKENRTTTDAGFVLSPLLARQDLSEEAAKSAVTAALDWLAIYYETQGAEFVLKNLLGKTYVSDSQRSHCIMVAVFRLEKVLHTPEASFLLRHILKDKDLSGKEKERVIICALEWLQVHSDRAEIDFVFKRLLRNPTISDEVWRKVANHALSWMRRTPLSYDRDHALNSLMTRVSLLSNEEKEYLKGEAQKWMGAFPYAKEKERLQKHLFWLTSNMPLANTTNPSVPLQTQVSLSDFLRKHAEQSTLPEVDYLKQGFETALSMIKNDHPGCAGYYLTALIPLAACLGDTAFSKNVHEAVRLLIAHPKVSPVQLKGFARSTYELLQWGAWPDQAEGQKILNSLGIQDDVL